MNYTNDERLYIHGKYIEGHGEDKLKIVNPANGKVIATTSTANAQDVDKAVESARKGQAVWTNTSPRERTRILLAAAKILRSRNEELAELETLNTGKPFSETSKIDIISGAEVLEYYAGLIPILEGSHIPLRKTSLVYTCREPLGVIGAVGAWNYPIQIALWKSAPALAAGNAMVFKPSELTPLTTLRLAKIYSESGLPDGVFNVVLGTGITVGTYLVSHENISKISFTGGIETGKQVMSCAALSSLKEITMELGGKSPLIITKNASIDLAANIAMMANFFSSGQVCTHGTRVYIHKKKKEKFEKKILEKMAFIRPGNVFNISTNFGPLINFEHRKKVLHYIKHGIKEGATLLYGGNILRGRKFEKGSWIEPTIFSNCYDTMKIVKEEIFGPVMTILTYENEEEVIRRANFTHYGLAAGVVSEDIKYAHRIIHKLNAGICWINTWGESPPEVPVGGYKSSGIGRENGIDTLKNHTQIKSIQIEMSDFQSVFN